VIDFRRADALALAAVIAWLVCAWIVLSGIVA
jgi:hypothetical protein